MIIDVWKIITIVLSISALVYLVAPAIPAITGLFTVNSGEKVTVELFVMSYCPYGIQAQQGIIPAIQALGSNVDFSVKFVDYIMHGKQEIDENLRQYCIQKEEFSKYLTYLSCFVSSKNSASCLTSAAIDASKINSCVSTTDAMFNVTALFNDKSTWNGGAYPQFPIHASLNTQYGVQGSPTLVVNGKQVSPSSRSADGFLSAICASFNIKPSACSSVVSSTAAATSGSCS